MSEKNMVKCPQCGFNSNKAGALRCPRCNKTLYKIAGCNGACYKCFQSHKGDSASEGCCEDMVNENKKDEV